MDCVWRLSKRFLSLFFLVVVVVFREREERKWRICRETSGVFSVKMIERN